MLNLGRAALTLALLIAVYGIAASLYGARAGRPQWVDSGRRAVYALAAVLTVSFAVLEAAFVRSDLSFAVVAGHSSTTTPLLYRGAAAWSSQEGSLLLWVWLLSLWSSLALFLTRRSHRDVAPYATTVLLGFGAFFCSLAVFAVNPFSVSTPVPAEGAGLQPLLRHPSMMIHPPLLYSGYTLFTVPFAFAVGALVTGRLDAHWIRATRRFSLAAWLALGAGILIGARWSWAELGWGGYWAWDPVENASLMPWLTGTALIHSAIMQEKRGMLKVWNVSLVLATGILAILGTFLVRSGILESIHAFGGSTLGRPFLGLIAVLMLGSVALVAARQSALRSDARLEAVFSRESMFVLNNVVLVGLCFVIFWGTLFPLISEAVSGRKASVGPPWFDRYTVPLAILLVLLSGVAPLVASRRARARNTRRSLRVPLAVAGICGVAFAALGAGRRPWALAMFCAGAFVAAVVIEEYRRGVRARRAVSNQSAIGAVVGLLRRNRRRYGGYLVHLGVAVLFAGVAASSAFQHVVDVRLRPGQTVRVGGYDVRYVRATSSVSSDKVTLGAVLDVSDDGHHAWTLTPTRAYYRSQDGSLGPLARYFDGEATSEVGLAAGLRRDVWTAVQPDVGAMQKMITGIDKRFPLAGGGTEALLLGVVGQRYETLPPPASFRLLVSPLVEWIWLGGIIALLGGLIAVWPPGLGAGAHRRAPTAERLRLRRAPSHA